MINDFETGSLGPPDVIARTGAKLLPLAIVKDPETWGYQGQRSVILPRCDSSSKRLGLGPPRVEAESGGGRARGACRGGRTAVARGGGAGTLRPCAGRPGRPHHGVGH